MKSNRKTILVTGGCGYLGSQLIRDLVNDAWDAGQTFIRILDNLQSGNYQALMRLPKQGLFEFIEGDILDPATLRLALRGVDIVIHLAAIVRTPMSFESPTWLEQVNHWGTAHLVEACLETGISKFIYTSSAAVYGPGGPFAETAICRPQGAYAQSKRHAEEAIYQAKQRGLRPIILRFGALYGYAPVTRFDAFINRLIYLAGVERSVTVYGDGQQKRPVLHVQDASAVISALVNGTLDLPTDVINVVEANVAVLDVVAALRKAKPNLSVQFTEQDIRTHLSFEVDSAQLCTYGWRPQQTLGDGVAELLNHFQHFQKLQYL